MRGYIKTDELYVAKIAMIDRRGHSCELRQLAFVTPVLDEVNSLRYNVNGWYRYVTKPGFVCDEETRPSHCQTYIYDLKKFDQFYPQKNRGKIKIKALKRKEKSLNQERQI